jgi:hypothetical protein
MSDVTRILSRIEQAIRKAGKLLSLARPEINDREYLIVMCSAYRKIQR